MKPALSLVFFTVLSGAGLGLSVFIALFPLPAEAGAAATAASLGLVAAGLGASVLHLANPKNAWRAVMRVRTSWLSREAVLAAAFFPLMVAGWWLESAVAQWAAAACAMLTVFCTAMIYQSLKTIPQWNHPLTALNYLALSLMSGGVVYHLLASGGEDFPADAFLLGCILMAAAYMGKEFHYMRIGECKDIEVGAATGFSQARARLLDAGHTGETFLTQEFVYRCPAKKLWWLRQLALYPTFTSALGAMYISVHPFEKNLLLALAATAAMFAGLLVERWLFFAEAKHSVRAYHGEST